MEYDVDSTPGELEDFCSRADFVFNLAGVNRPKDQSSSWRGNFGLPPRCWTPSSATATGAPSCSPAPRRRACRAASRARSTASPSWRGGAVPQYSERTGAPVLIYRFPNLYGKWCRPRYNSAVATFCDAIANGRPYTVNDPSVGWSSSIDDSWTRCWVRCWDGSTAAVTRGSRG
ncbi:MAG: hypothetical protein ACLU37_02255 [Collinsella sp.]